MAQGDSGAARVTEYLISLVDFAFVECGFLLHVVRIHILSDPTTFSHSRGRESRIVLVLCIRLAVAQGGSGVARVTEYFIFRANFALF